jgi:anti-sigma B factor antagonist
VLLRTRQHVDPFDVLGSVDPMMVTTTDRLQAPVGTVLHVAGEVDTFAADDLRKHLRRVALEPGGAVVVDLTEVTFISCTGLSVLAEAQARLGPRLVLDGRSRIVTRLLELTGLVPFFTARTGIGAGPEEPRGATNDGPAHARRTVAGTWTFSRADLERVRGLLMGVHGCNAEQAWGLLARAAARHDVPVGEIVQLIIGGRRDAEHAPSSAAAVAALTVLMREPPEGAVHGEGAQASDAADRSGTRRI